MIPEIFVLVSTVCFQALGGTLVLHHAMSVERGFIGELSCFESVQISTGPVVAKEGQTVKRLCDFVGHKWADMITPNSYIVHSKNDYPSMEKKQVCLYCEKHRVRVEKWKYVS